jgi:glucokinase
MRKSATVNLTRSVNRSVILELIRENSPIARSQIARQLEVSLPTVMRIVDDLMDEGLVRPCDSQGQSTGGRPPALVEFDGKAYAVVGVDLSGTRMFGTVADLSGGIQHELYVSPKKGDGPADHLERLCEIIETLLDAPRPSGQKIRGVGIGVPGLTLVPDGFVTWGPCLAWRYLPFKKILNDRFEPWVNWGLVQAAAYKTWWLSLWTQGSVLGSLLEALYTGDTIKLLVRSATCCPESSSWGGIMTSSVL